MTKYTIYDGTSNVLTPIGENLTPEQWLNRHPIGKYRKTVVGSRLTDNLVEGSLMLDYEKFVAMMEECGCDFSECTTDEEVLAKIEEFEKKPVVDNTISDATRTADALEDLVLLQELQMDAANA